MAKRGELSLRPEDELPPHKVRDKNKAHRALLVNNAGSLLKNPSNSWIRNVAKIIDMFTTPYQVMAVSEWDPELFNVLPENSTYMPNA